MALDVGIFLPTMSGPDERPGDVAAAARHAEDLGLESVWVVDQLVVGGGALRDLIAGRPVQLDGRPDGPLVQLAPGAKVPPILVGGMSGPALARAARHADGWFTPPVPPADVADGHARLANGTGRPNSWPRRARCWPEARDRRGSAVRGPWWPAFSGPRPPVNRAYECLQ